MVGVGILVFFWEGAMLVSGRVNMKNWQMLCPFFWGWKMIWKIEAWTCNCNEQFGYSLFSFLPAPPGFQKTIFAQVYTHYICIYGPASLGTSPPPHPMVMGLYSSAPVPPSPLWCGWCGWWWVVVGGGGGWWWWKKLYMYVYECISTPLPPVVWVVWVVVGGGGGGGGRSCICMYMNVYCICMVWMYICICISLWICMRICYYVVLRSTT